MADDQERRKNLSEVAQIGWDVFKGALEAYPAGTLKKFTLGGLAVGAGIGWAARKFFSSKNDV